MKIKNYFLLTIKWLFIAIINGIICGVIGTLFSKTAAFVTHIRIENDWLIYLLPFGGLLVVLTYKLFKTEGIGTNNVFNSVKSENSITYKIAPSVFLGTIFSHLFGASVGREGAALQIGGGISSLLSKIFKLNENERKIIIMCGMSGLFSAVFGTPLAATVFVIEVVLRKFCMYAALPQLITSISAYITAHTLNAHAERFLLKNIPHFSFQTVWQIILVIFTSIIMCFLLCISLRFSKKTFEKSIKNPYLRITLGGIVIVLFTLFIGNTDYNGGGIDIIEGVFKNDVKLEASLLKILFTAICVGAGFKGGEIIPTLFVGATGGGAVASLIGLPISFGGAIGMSVLFCGATKCPLATILLAAEMFNGQGIMYIIPCVFISYIICRFNGLYGKYPHLFAKKNRTEI